MSEWRVVTEHPKIGQVVLEQAGAMRDAATIVLHHHEWYDGRGYPHGLAGTEIPIGARIVSIVDAYEAMVAGRPYRGAITHEEALVELRRQGGVQFDPELVEVFAALFANGLPWELEPYDPMDDLHDAGIPVLSGHEQAPSEGSPRTAALNRVAEGGGRLGAARGRPQTTAETHDAVHERRRRAVS
jgi:hypothetical protein